MFLDAKYRPEGADNTEQAGGAAGGAGNSTQKLTSDLKMTMDEACLILNVKKDSPMETVLKVCLASLPHILCPLLIRFRVAIRKHIQGKRPTRPTSGTRDARAPAHTRITREAVETGLLALPAE